MTNDTQQFPTRHSTPPPPQRRRRRGRRTLHYLLLVLLVLVVGTALSLTVFFKLENIVVSGTEHYDPEEIIAATDLELEENLFLAPTKEIPQTLIQTFPYIEEVQVHRSLPPTIEISITPSVPYAALQIGEEYVLITQKGKVLERGLMLLPADVLLVKGLDIGERQPGEYLGEYTPEKAPPDASDSLKESIRDGNTQAQIQAEKEKDALGVIQYMNQAIEATEFHGITNLDLSDPLNMTVMYENRLLLRLGTELDLEYKLAHIKMDIERLHPQAHGQLRAENILLGRQNGQVVFTADEGYDNTGRPLTSPGQSDRELLDPETDLEDPQDDEKEEDTQQKPPTTTPTPTPTPQPTQPTPTPTPTPDPTPQPDPTPPASTPPAQTSPDPPLVDDLPSGNGNTSQEDDFLPLPDV